MTFHRVVVYSRAWRYGAGLYAQGVAAGLSKAGYPVTFIAPAGEPDDLADLPPMMRRIRPVRELVGPAPRFKRTVYSFRRTFSGLFNLLGARLSSSNFVVSIPDPFLFSIWFILLLRLTGARVVFVCHDPEPHTWELPAKFRWLERAGYDLMYRMATKVVVLARSAKTELIRVFDVSEHKIEVIPHGAFAIESVGPSLNSRSLLLFGTIRRNKCVREAILGVIAARAEGCEVKLIIAGEADPSDLAYLDECRTLAAQYPDGISFEYGYVSDARVTELLQFNDAVLLPYGDFNSQSGVAVLAGIAGRPIIATVVGGIGDLIESGLTAVEISSPGDASDISAAILEFYKLPHDHWSMKAEASRRRLLQALDWTNIGHSFGLLFDVSPQSTRSSSE